MRFAYSTIGYGPFFSDIRPILDEIADAGFKGVEIAQPPSNLNISADDLAKELDHRQLSLAGMMFGPLVERTQFCKNVLSPTYLLVNNPDVRVDDCKAELVLHPEAYRKIQYLDDAFDLMLVDDRLRLILDTAHQLIVGEDPVFCLERAKRKTTAIHLKDWTDTRGRTIRRYHLGFTKLGEGDLDVKKYFKKLRRIGFDGWVVAEVEPTQDGLLEHPHDVAIKLQNYSDISPIRIGRKKFFSQNSIGSFARIAKGKVHSYLNSYLELSTQDYNRHLKRLPQILAEILDCKVVEIYLANQRRDELTFLSSSDVKLTDQKNLIFTLSKKRSGRVIQERRLYDVWDKDDENTYEELLGEDNPRHVLTIPVFENSNPTTSHMVINAFYQEKPVVNQHDVLFISRTISDLANLMLDRRCFNESIKVTFHEGQFGELNAFLSKLEQITGTAVDAKKVEIQLVGNKNFENSAEAKMVSKSKQPLVFPNRAIVPWISSKTSSTVALVLLNGKKSLAFPPLFTDEDMATVDAIGGAAIPYIEKAVQDDRDNRALGIFSHEIRQPIGFIANASNDLLDLLGIGNEGELASDLNCWANLLSREIRNTDIFRSWPKKLVPQREFVRIHQTLNSAKRDCLPILKKLDLTFDHVDISALQELPTLKFDREFLRQIAFNVISNSIHYSDEEKTRKITIQCTQDVSRITLWFKDYGVGFDKKSYENAFVSGKRGPNAFNYHVFGEGLGLWVSRQLLNTLGGRIRIASFANPTLIAVELPHKG